MEEVETLGKGKSGMINVMTVEVQTVIQDILASSSGKL